MRDGDAERLSRLDVDEDFKLGGSLYWQVTGFLASQDAAGIDAGKMTNPAVALPRPKARIDRAFSKKAPQIGLRNLPRRPFSGRRDRRHTWPNAICGVR